MTRFGQLEQEFGLTNLEELTADLKNASMTAEQLQRQASELARTYQDTDHFEVHENEMDEISELAIEYGKGLHELAMSVEVKHAGVIFNASAAMLKLALDARQLKLEKKFKLMKLELDQMKLDRMIPDVTQQIDTTNVRILDRNELLAQLRDIAQTNK